MKNPAHKFGLFTLLIIQAIFLSGCTTALWEEDRFARFHQPANPTNLRLFHSSRNQNVLVEYEEIREGDNLTRRRAYWADLNVKRLEAGRKPRFVSIQDAPDLVSIPMVDAPGVGKALPTEGLCAILSTNGHSFTLYSKNKECFGQTLPTYYDGSLRRFKQVILTPFAVAMDVTIIVPIIALVVADDSDLSRLQSR